MDFDIINCNAIRSKNDLSGIRTHTLLISHETSFDRSQAPYPWAMRPRADELTVRLTKFLVLF